MKKWYAVQIGSNFDCDYGSTVKREALAMARREARKHPGVEVRIAICSTDSDFCTDEIIVQQGARC